jgi:hypothetical protein
MLGVQGSLLGVQVSRARVDARVDVQKSEGVLDS